MVGTVGDKTALHAPNGRDEGYYGEEAATLGDRIAAARNAAGLTQAGLASRLGVGVKVVSSWEHDRSEPRANRLAMLSGLLGVSVTWLLSGVGDGVAPPNEAEAEASGPRQLELVIRGPDADTLRQFYVDLLGCAVLEAAEGVVTFEFFGHRLVAEIGDGAANGALETRIRLAWRDWRALVDRLRAANAAFRLEPSILNVGAPAEEGAFSIDDPGGARWGFRAAAEFG